MQKTSCLILKLLILKKKHIGWGFLYADGCVGSVESKIELSLAERDFHHIEKFRNFIGINNKISYRPKTKAYRYSFRSESCKQDLINKGCIPKKSLILKYPTYEQVPKKFSKDFIRGYFDGDVGLQIPPLVFKLALLEQ